MTQATGIHLMNTALLVVLIASIPPILVATAVGLVVALLQALTQIQDQTLPYALKLVATVMSLVFASNLIFGQLYTFAVAMFRDFPMYVK
jgi:type III secretion protein S